MHTKASVQMAMVYACLNDGESVWAVRRVIVGVLNRVCVFVVRQVGVFCSGEWHWCTQQHNNV